MKVVKNIHVICCKEAAYSDGDAVIGEDEGGVDAGELGVGHVELSLFRKSPKKRGFNSEENKRIGLGKFRKRKKEDQNNKWPLCVQIYTENETKF